MRQTGRAKDRITGHLQEHIGLYIFIIVLFIVGIVFGSIAVKIMQAAQKEALLSYLQGFLGTLVGEGKINAAPVLYKVLLKYLEIGGFVWLAGLIIIGIPAILIVIFAKGFVLGFTVGFLIEEMHWKGLVLALVAVFPQNIFAVPGIIILSAGALSFSAVLLRRRMATQRRHFRQEFTGYSCFCLGVSILLIIAALVETYFCPVFMRLVSTYLM